MGRRFLLDEHVLDALPSIKLWNEPGGGRQAILLRPFTLALAILEHAFRIHYVCDWNDDTISGDTVANGGIDGAVV